MVTYSGFSTQNACLPRNTNNQIANLENPYGLPTGTGSLIWGDKFKIFDYQLVIQDFINALSIPVGSKVGQPSFGTTIYNFIFEPNSIENQRAIDAEIRRIASQDPRIQIGSITVFSQDNGVSVQVEMSVVPFNNVQVQKIYFNQSTTKALLT